MKAAISALIIAFSFGAAGIAGGTSDDLFALDGLAVLSQSAESTASDGLFAPDDLSSIYGKCNGSRKC